MQEQTRQRLARVARNLRLLPALDTALFVRDALRHRRGNRNFLRQHADFAVPPLRLCFEAYNHTSYQAYFDSGRQHADFIASTLNALLGARRMRICEWGCGAARILRHLPSRLTDASAELHGTDYDPRAVAWCRREIAGIQFGLNSLQPPLPFPGSFFSGVYSVSVFTHLPGEAFAAWMSELERVVAADGVLIFTTHGRKYESKLLPDEREKFRSGQPVYRVNAVLGSKGFAAYHPAEWVRSNLPRSLQVIAHLEDASAHALAQDVWVARKAPNGTA